MTASIEAMAREAGAWGAPGLYMFHAEELTRFAALVRAQAESEAHAAIDSSEAKIVRNRLDGYPGHEDHALTLAERIEALSRYAADWKRWCLEAEESAKSARAQALEEAARVCDQRRAVVNDEGTDAEKFAAAYLAASIRALPPLE